MKISFHPETLSPLSGEAGVRGTKKKILKFRIIVPHSSLPEAVKKFPKSPPPCPSPVKGEEIL